MRATVITHRRPDDTAGALAALLDAARESACTLRFDPEETRKHGLRPAEGLELEAPMGHDVDLCVVLGGDGSILTALRHYAGTTVPTFAVNFGELGFLATIEPEEAAGGFRRAFAGEFERLMLPTIGLGSHDGAPQAINDVSVHRKPGARVAQLAYAVGAQEIGRVRCDGVVVSTPAGSTGYNLANGGPVMAWGVEGMAVSFIAPHSLTARALVAAPGDVLTVSNRSREEPVEGAIDGRPMRAVAPGASVDLRFQLDRACLAQVPGSSFYGRLREKFGRLTGL